MSGVLATAGHAVSHSGGGGHGVTYVSGGGFPIWIAVVIGVILILVLAIALAATRPWGGAYRSRDEVIVRRRPLRRRSVVEDELL